MRDEHPSEKKPDVASIINGKPTGGPLSYQVGLAREVGVGRGADGVALGPVCVLINGYDLATGAIPEDSGYIAASSYVVHPGYNTATVENDIALLFLPFPIGEDENFKFATLNEDPTVPAVGEELFVSGWGKTSPLPGDNRSPILLGTNVDYVTNEQCQSDYVDSTLTHNTITDDMMCAAGDGTGTCQGDSGGPLMIANGDGPAMDPPIQVGIVSWADGCADPNFPTVFTRVSSYIDWIRSTACQEVGELCPSSSKSGKVVSRP
ncbi:hypothetical protein ACHAWC_002645 [Mediolabrus comicus]